MSAVAGICIAILAFVVATLTAKLFYALIGLVHDVINLVIPMPDLLGTVMDTLSDVSDNMETISGARWLYLAVVAALPGMVALVENDVRGIEVGRIERRRRSMILHAILR